MSLIYFKHIHLRLTEQALLDNVTLRVEAKDRIAIIGRNGAGKSTLMKLIEGVIEPDSGSIERNVGRISRLAQAVPYDLSGTVEAYVTQEMHRICGQDWGDHYRVARVLSRLQLSPTAALENLSGGQMRRCLLAAALVVEPDLLLLDEPTNHLDLESIQWLEAFLLQSNLTFILISHDRTFLQSVCNQVMELDRGNLIQCKGSYQHFLEHRAQQIKAQEKYESEFNKRLAQEEVWIRQGIKARRTRNEGRVRALQKMRNEVAQRRRQQGSIQFQEQDVHQSGKHVFIVENLSFHFKDKKIIDDFSCVIQRQDKIGIIGPNGCGKSTLIRCLLQEIEPSSGSVKHGTQLQVAYFDQHKQQLDPESLVMDVVSGGRSMIDIHGKSKHIISYCQDFLFTPQQARSKVKFLSGGECHRLLLAKLFSNPANVLVLDEPTNDLDIESLELLEEYLLSYSGTVLLISHDRALLNHVVTSTLVFEGQGQIQHYVGGYDDYLTQRKVDSATPCGALKLEESETKLTAVTPLSYSERKELNKLPAKIEKREGEMMRLQEHMSQPEYFKQPIEVHRQDQEQLAQMQHELDECYHRWEELMNKEV